MQLDKSYFINQIEQYLLKMDKDEMKPYAVKVNYSGTKWYFLDAPDESEAEEVACEMFGNEFKLRDVETEAFAERDSDD
jgi:hypothetical protein